MGSEFRSVRLTVPTLRVLSAVLSAMPDQIAGSEVASVTKLSSGTLYPILLRLEEAGWLHSQWEQGDAAVLGRPRRRLYKLTAAGLNHARLAFREVQAIGEAVWT
jgi:DNA-binding PadR family transcriptional regulator